MPEPLPGLVSPNRGRVGAVCGRYAASRNPDDLVEEFEVVDAPEQALPKSWNVAPTQDVYAVLERAPRDDKEAPPRRRLQVAREHIIAFGQGIRQASQRP